jgi:predicted dehydrogenase
MGLPKLRVALVGAAGKVAAPCHLNAWRSVRNHDLAAVCDVDRVAVNAIGDQWGIERRFTDYAELLSDPDIDAVDIVTPPFLHAEMTVAAARAGKHVYVEKPMAQSIAEGQRMVSEAAAADVTLMVGESYVFQNSLVRARKLIDNGEIGPVRHVRQTKGPWVMRDEETRRLGGKGHFIPWRIDPRLSGGGPYPWLMDHGAHFFATARYLAGDESIDTVSTLAVDAAGQYREAGGEALQDAVVSVAWRYGDPNIDGAWTRVSTPFAANELVGFRTEVYGEAGMIRVFGEGGGGSAGPVQPPAVELITARGRTAIELDEAADRVWQSNVNYYDQSHANALQHFVDSSLDRSVPRYDGREGLKDLTATLAALKSAIDGRPIALADVADEWTAYGA